MRAFTVIGPSQSGKTALIEGLSGLDGSRRQSLRLLGDVAITAFDFMQDRWAAFDVPGGRDSLHLAGPALAASDAAVLCVPAQADAAVLAAPYLRLLEEAGIPTFLFINKIDLTDDRISDIVASLQHYCRHGIALRQVPIRTGNEVTGVVDLISERAWKYQEGRRSSLVELPLSVQDREQEARSDLLEAFADFDDSLLEQIIEDRQPLTEDVYSVATHVFQHHDLIPAFLGAASHGNGLLRLMKSLRHEAPGSGALRHRLDLPDDMIAAGCLADQQKHLGKVILVRALADGVGQGTRLGGAGMGNLNALDGKSPAPSTLAPGEFALAIKSDHVSAGTFLAADRAAPLPDWAHAHAPSLKRRIHPAHEKDESKLSAALARLAEIDPGLSVSQDEMTGSPVIGVQGHQHLKATMSKLLDAFGIAAECTDVPAAMRETIRKSATVHHRHRKQSGGAGQFADIVLDVAPGAPGSGFAFEERIRGGVVPRNYIPSVEAGARDALAEGPHGHVVVDIRVSLTDGKSHSVDSSDFAFRTAGQNAVKEALRQAGTKVLQPIIGVEIHVPSVFTGSLVQLLSGLKGQVLGFEGNPEAPGWDLFRALLPMSSEEDLWAALGSATRGTAWFASELHHFEELREPVPS